MSESNIELKTLLTIKLYFISSLNINNFIKIRKLRIAMMTLILVAQGMQGQVLISLLFGDNLNSPTLKFGLDGGANFSTLSNVSGSKYRPGFNLGFYFDFLLKKR